MPAVALPEQHGARVQKAVAGAEGQEVDHTLRQGRGEEALDQLEVAMPYGAGGAPVWLPFMETLSQTFDVIAPGRAERRSS